MEITPQIRQMFRHIHNEDDARDEALDFMYDEDAQYEAYRDRCWEDGVTPLPR